MSIIKECPASERPREKFLQQGAKSLSDAELLAIFLRTGVKGKDVLTLAQELIDTFKIKGLYQLRLEDIKSIKGIGMAKYVQLQAVLELSQRYLLSSVNKGDSITSPSLMKDYLIGRLGNQVEEVFSVVFLDTQNRITEYEELFHGSISQAAIYPRVIVRKCIEYNAAAIIVAHNHPSGKLLASKEDITITKRLKEILDIIDVKLLDHFIVGKTDIFSMIEAKKI